jgi:hypothetical protein
MKACCLDEAKRNLLKHRDVAQCDGCGALVLGYGVEQDFRDTLATLAANGTAHEHARLGELWIIAKARRS